MAAITNADGSIRATVLDDPYPLYRELREEDPVHYDPSLGGWMVTRYADVRACVTDPRLSSERTQAYLSELPSVDRERFRRFADARGDMLLFCDGEKHERLRRAVAGALRSLHDQRLLAAIETRAEDLLDELVGDGPTDLIAGFALPLPIAVLVDMLGVPAADAPRLRDWATAFNLAIGGVIQPDLVGRAQTAVEEVSAYLDEHLREGGGGSPLLAYLDGERAAGRIDSSELHASCLMLITAGHETVSNLVGNGLLALLRNPAQLRQLQSEPGFPAGAVDELMRYDAPVQLTAREATTELELGGKRIEAGQRVIPIWGAANRDPEIFEDPDLLDLKRFRPGRQLGFGSGRHRCVGASLGREEAEIALAAVLRRFSQIELAGPPIRKENFSFRGLQQLLVDACPA